MSNLQRKVAFYNLAQEQILDDQTTKKLSCEEIEENFQYIYGKMQELPADHRAVRIERADSVIVAEVLQYKQEEHYAFIKIGYQNPANTTALRDQKTLESAAIPMEESQRVELFTYCYIDFTTCIVSYLNLISAPRISALRAMFDYFLEGGCRISTTLASIMSTDIIDLIQNKRISKLNVTVAVPDDEVLAQVIGVDRDAFAQLQYNNTIQCSLSISAPPLKSMFKSPTVLDRMVAGIRDKWGKNLLGLKVNAKGEGETSQVYDLMQHSFTQKIVFPAEDFSQITEQEFYEKISECYKNQNEILERYIRNLTE